jgi:hypothetical protein
VSTNLEALFIYLLGSSPSHTVTYRIFGIIYVETCAPHLCWYLSGIFLDVGGTRSKLHLTSLFYDSPISAIAGFGHYLLSLDILKLLRRLTRA